MEHGGTTAGCGRAVSPKVVLARAVNAAVGVRNSGACCARQGETSAVRLRRTLPIHGGRDALAVTDVCATA
jgi:hypothetical protein